MLTEPLRETEPTSPVPEAEPLGWVLSATGSQATVRLQAPHRGRASDAGRPARSA